MKRNIIIILIFFTVLKFGSGFSNRDWFEISGCYSLGGTIIKNKTILPANEPGSCLQWCGTEAVALQNTTCLCINDVQNLSRTVDFSCSQSCSGVEEKFKCGGISNDHISVYRERREMSREWGSLNGSECLTYSRTAEQIVGQFVPESCTEKHFYYCYSETKFESTNCFIRTDINDKRTWYEALEACWPLQTLWTAQDADTCSDRYIREGKFWVAVYQWTKVVPTTTISTTTAPSSAASITSTTLSATTITKSYTSTSTMTPSSSTKSGNPSTTTAGTSTSTTSSSSTSTTSTTIAPNIATAVSTNSTSMTAATSTSTKTTQRSGAPTSKIGTTPSTSKTTSFYIDPANIGLDGKESSTSKTTGFQIDSPNIGLGAGMGLSVGFLISITIAYCRTRNKCTDTSRSENHLSYFQRGARTFDKHVMTIPAPLDHKWKQNGFINTSRDLEDDEKNENTTL